MEKRKPRLHRRKEVSSCGLACDGKEYADALLLGEEVHI